MRRPGDPCRDVATASAAQCRPIIRCTLSPSVTICHHPAWIAAPHSPRPSNLPYNPRQFLPRERRSRRWHAGRNRRLRSWANVAHDPGRFRPRVPPRALRPGCAGRCASGGMGENARCPGSGTDGDRNRRRDARFAPRTHIRQARPRAPLPELFMRNGQTGNGAWQNGARPLLPLWEKVSPKATDEGCWKK
ncbi:hypothetical protein GGQ99_001982 [Aminobacter niigataensis]|uniref:Uncharacterized protein n=1 Tax=Aminobacter niigataensis TaxID=83265 RepID=A0ABR6L095_9HYPH|nr:hypothetical protein [Aminobacter niigataensis]